MLPYFCENFISHITWPRGLCIGAWARNEGIEVQIGRRLCARTIRISQAVLEAEPILRRELCDGAIILNADPNVFEIVLQYIGQNKFLVYMPLGRNPLDQLTGGTDPMLNLAKAYHLARMLDHLQMQNELIDIFSINYRHLLRDRALMKPSSEAFKYLRDYAGSYSRCEKFIIEFYAGLAARTKVFEVEDFERLPHDIATQLRLRCMHILHGYGDRVLQGHKCFKVSALHKTRHVTPLHVIRPPLASAENVVTAAQVEWEQSLSTSGQTALASVPTRVPVPVSSNDRHIHRSRLCLPANIRHDYVIGSPSVALHVEAAASHTQANATLVITTRLPLMAPNPAQ